MAQLFEDWTDYSLGDDPTVDVASGDASPRWESIVLGDVRAALEVKEAGGVRYLEMDGQAGFGTESVIDTIAATLIGTNGVVPGAVEVFSRSRATFRSGVNRSIRVALRVTGPFDGADGDAYEARDNQHRIRRWNAGTVTVIADERNGHDPVEGTWYNRLTRVETIDASTVRVQAKTWTGDPITDEPANWDAEHDDISADRLTADGQLGPAIQVRASNLGDAAIIDVEFVGLGWDGDPAPREAEIVEVTVTVDPNDLPETLTGWRWALFGSPLVNEWLAPLAQGADGEWTPAGEFTVDVTRIMEPQETGYLYVTNSDGTISPHLHHGRPAQAQEVVE